MSAPTISIRKSLREYLEIKCDRDPSSGRPVSRRTGRTITAIVPVHLYGQMADMDPILKLAEAYDLLVVEDACQAHGAEYFSRDEQRWRKAGSMGKAAAFSFYPGKNLGACGEAGAVTTNNPEVADMVRKLRDHGQAAKYYHDIEGYNGRLDAIQAGILHAKLAQLTGVESQRRQIAKAYGEQLAGIDGLVLPFEPSWSRAIYHLYVVRVPDRQEMQNSLKAAGIGTGIHYPVPLHLQQAYRSLGYRSGDFPMTEKRRVGNSLPADVPAADGQPTRPSGPGAKGMYGFPQPRFVTTRLRAPIFRYSYRTPVSQMLARMHTQ